MQSANFQRTTALSQKTVRIESLSLAQEIPRIAHVSIHELLALLAAGLAQGVSTAEMGGIAFEGLSVGCWGATQPCGLRTVSGENHVCRRRLLRKDVAARLCCRSERVGFE